MASKQGPSGGLIALAIINIVFSVLLVCTGATGLVISGDSGAFMAPQLQDEQMEVPPMPDEVQSHQRIKAGVALVEGILLAAGGIGLLICARWSPTVCRIFAVFCILSSIGLFGMYVLTVGEAHQEWIKEVMRQSTNQQQEMPAGLMDSISAFAGPMGEICCASPLVIYSIVLLVVLSRPSIKRQFEPEMPAPPDSLTPVNTQTNEHDTDDRVPPEQF